MSDAIKKLIEHVTEECSAVDMEARYDDMLNEIYSFRDVGGPFAHMEPSRVLKEMDPVAYRCGMADEDSSDVLFEIGDNYYDKDDVEHERDEFISDLESELADAESELEDMQNADNHEDNDDIQHVKDKISQLEADIKECKDYVF